MFDSFFLTILLYWVANGFLTEIQAEPLNYANLFYHLAIKINISESNSIFNKVPNPLRERRKNTHTETHKLDSARNSYI